LTSAAARDGQGRRLRPQQEAPATGRRALLVVCRVGGAARGARGGGGQRGFADGRAEVAALHRVLLEEKLQEADGVLFGFPTRYGAMAAQMKAFFDSTGSLWEAQKLAGKPAGFFVSTGTQGGGQEIDHGVRIEHSLLLFQVSFI